MGFKLKELQTINIKKEITHLSVKQKLKCICEYLADNKIFFNGNAG